MLHRPRLGAAQVILTTRPIRVDRDFLGRLRAEPRHRRRRHQPDVRAAGELGRGLRRAAWAVQRGARHAGGLSAAVVESNGRDGLRVLRGHHHHETDGVEC